MDKEHIEKDKGTGTGWEKKIEKEKEKERRGSKLSPHDCPTNRDIIESISVRMCISTPIYSAFSF